MVAQYAHSGPLPPAREYEHYGRVEPTAPDRILRMAENEQAFRHRVVDTELNADVRAHFTGLAMGFVMGLILIIGAIHLAAQGQEAVPLALIGAGGTVLVAGFLKARRGPAQPNRPGKKVSNEDETRSIEDES